MEYLLLACVTLLIGCCVAALVLEPPAKIGERSSTGGTKGPGARRSGHPGRPRNGNADTAPPAAVTPATDVAPSVVTARRDAPPTDLRGAVPDDAPPYSPQELRSLLDRRAPASPRAS